MRVVVYHDKYGCDTGCCGHTVEVDGKSRFQFDHAETGQDPIEYAKELVLDAFGKSHYDSLDWDNVVVVNDGIADWKSCNW